MANRSDRSKNQGKKPITIKRSSLGLLIVGVFLIYLLAVLALSRLTSSEPGTREDTQTQATQTDDGETAKPEAVPSDRKGFIVYIDRLIKSGKAEDTTRAMALIHEHWGKELQTDPELRQLLERVMAADEQIMQPEMEKAYVERVNNHWLPKLENLGMERPGDLRSLWKRHAELQELAYAVNDGADLDGEDASAARAKLKDALSKKQRALFPVLRNAYRDFLRAEIWEADIEVAVEGTGDRTIRMTSFHFVTNGNIAAMQRKADLILRKLRFKKAVYETYRGSRHYSFALSSPDDGDVGAWVGSRFEQAPE
ncbi:MAG: hypothetical protein H6917_02860 [Novosphingobium sp.]|nr:hypothetical protein [Novosphingobium sp.]MCP5401310.1 hypothetical protein [Novosphingobium sp.]